MQMILKFKSEINQEHSFAEKFLLHLYAEKRL